MFVRLPESHCDAQLLDFRVVAAEKLCQEAARDPDITLGQVLTTQHPAPEGLYIRARVKKSVGSALPPLVRDQGYRTSSSPRHKPWHDASTAPRTARADTIWVSHQSQLGRLQQSEYSTAPCRG